MIDPTAIYRWMPVFYGLDHSETPAWVVGTPVLYDDGRFVVEVRDVRGGAVSTQPLRFIRPATSAESADWKLPRGVEMRRPAGEVGTLSLRRLKGELAKSGVNVEDFERLAAKHGIGRDGE